MFIHIDQKGNFGEILKSAEYPGRIVISFAPNDGSDIITSMAINGILNNNLYEFSASFNEEFLGKNTTNVEMEQIYDGNRDIPGSPINNIIYSEIRGYSDSAETENNVIYDIQRNTIIHDSIMSDNRYNCGINARFSELMENICNPIQNDDVNDLIPDRE